MQRVAAPVWRSRDGGGFRCRGALNPAISTIDAETAAAIIRVTGGNFRLLDRLLTQMDRIMRINNLAQVTKGVVESARENVTLHEIRRLWIVSIGSALFEEAYVFVPKIVGPRHNKRLTGLFVPLFPKPQVHRSLEANRVPILIDINETFKKTDDALEIRKLLKDRLYIPERLPDADGEPSSKVLEDLKKSFQGIRQETLRLRLVSLLAFVFALVAAFAIWQWVSAAIAERKAREAASQANVSLARNSQAVENDNQALAYLANALRLNPRNSEAGTLIAALLTQESWPVVTAAMKHDDAVSSAQFSADGQRVVTASDDRTARVWDIPTITAKDSAADVNMLTDLAEATAGLDLQAFGQTEILAALTPDQVKATREKIAAKFVRTSSNLTPLQRLMKWSVSERRSRTISPLSEMTVAEWVENRIKDGTLDGLRAAVEVDPTNARLAAHFGGALADYALIEGTDPAEAGRARAEADFQTRRALKLAPDNDEVKAITQNNLGTALYNQGIRTEGAKAAELLAEAVAAYRSALEIYTRERQPQDWARSQDNLGGALYELGTRSGAEEGRKLLEDAIAAYRSALEVFTKADLPQSWAATQNNLGIALRELGNQLEEKEGLKLKRESVELLRDVVSYQPDDLSRYRLASALGDLAFMLVLDSQFAEAQARCEEAQRLVNEIGDGIQKTDRDNLVAIQGNLAHALLFHGHYDEALAIYRKYWDKPLNGKTFRDATLEDFAAFDKAGLTHPDLSRMKLALRHLRSEAPSP